MYPIADYKILLSLLFMPYQIKNLMKKSRDSSVNVVSVFVFANIFCHHIKILLIISNFFKTGKATGGNWYQNLDDTLIREWVESILQCLDSKLIYHRS